MQCYSCTYISSCSDARCIERTHNGLWTETAMMNTPVRASLFWPRDQTRGRVFYSFFFVNNLKLTSLAQIHLNILAHNKRRKNQKRWNKARNYLYILSFCTPPTYSFLTWYPTHVSWAVIIYNYKIYNQLYCPELHTYTLFLNYIQCISRSSFRLWVRKIEKIIVYTIRKYTGNCTNDRLNIIINAYFVLLLLLDTEFHPIGTEVVVSYSNDFHKFRISWWKVYLYGIYIYVYYGKCS